MRHCCQGNSHRCYFKQPVWRLVTLRSGSLRKLFRYLCGERERKQLLFFLFPLTFIYQYIYFCFCFWQGYFQHVIKALIKNNPSILFHTSISFSPNIIDELGNMQIILLLLLVLLLNDEIFYLFFFDFYSQAKQAGITQCSRNQGR